MRQYKPEDIASFPPLFDEMEQFIEEQINQIKRAGLFTASISFAGMLLSIYVLDKLS